MVFLQAGQQRGHLSPLIAPEPGPKAYFGDPELPALVFGDEDFDVEFDLLAIVVELASADGYDGTFLRLLFRPVGNDDASLLDFLLAC